MNIGYPSTLDTGAVDAFYLCTVHETDKGRVVQAASEAIRRGDCSLAAAIIQDEYAFTPLSVERKGVPAYRAAKIFFRDGFIDRYSGKRLVFPPVLKIMSNSLPTNFPYHPHWKMDECHVAYWELYPAVDHVVPLERGGSDDDTNQERPHSKYLIQATGRGHYRASDLSAFGSLVSWLLPLGEGAGRNHKETWAGCSVSCTTAVRSPLIVSRSVSSLSLLLNTSRVFLASYLRL